MAQTNRSPPRPPGTTKLPDAITIRAYIPDDAEHVIALARELQSHESQFYDRLKPFHSIGYWYLEALQLDVESHNGSFLVAELNGAVAGYATLMIECSSAEECDEVLYTFAQVGDLAVGKSYRGQGVGKTLMRECERLAAAAGQRWLRLGVLSGNVSARKFYSRMGMEEVFQTLEKKLT